MRSAKFSPVDMRQISTRYKNCKKIELSITLREDEVNKIFIVLLLILTPIALSTLFSFNIHMQRSSVLTPLQTMIKKNDIEYQREFETNFFSKI